MKICANCVQATPVEIAGVLMTRRVWCEATGDSRPREHTCARWVAPISGKAIKAVAADWARDDMAAIAAGSWSRMFPAGKTFEGVVNGKTVAGRVVVGF